MAVVSKLDDGLGRTEETQALASSPEPPTPPRPGNSWGGLGKRAATSAPATPPCSHRAGACGRLGPAGANGTGGTAIRQTRPAALVSAQASRTRQVPDAPGWGVVGAVQQAAAVGAGAGHADVVATPGPAVAASPLPAHPGGLALRRWHLRHLLELHRVSRGECWPVPAVTLSGFCLRHQIVAATRRRYGSIGPPAEKGHRRVEPVRARPLESYSGRSQQFVRGKRRREALLKTGPRAVPPLLCTPAWG